MWNLDWNGNFMKIKFEYKNIVILLIFVEFFEVGFMILNEIDYCLWNNVIYLRYEFYEIYENWCLCILIKLY